MDIAARIAAVAGSLLRLFAVVAAVFGVAALGAGLFYGSGKLLLLALSGFGGAILAFTFGVFLRKAAAGTVMPLDTDGESAVSIVNRGGKG